MISYEAAVPAGVYSEQFPHSSTYEPFWSSTYPYFLTSNVDSYDNYYDETYYYEISNPVCFGNNDYVYYYPDAYQSFVPTTYDYQSGHFYNPVSDDYQEQTVSVYYAPLMYYVPICYVPVTYSFYDIHSQCYSPAPNLSDSSCFEYPISESRSENLRNYSATSEECSTFEIFYEEEGEHLNEANFSDDDKVENTDDKNLISDTEEIYCSSSDESVDDKREGKTLTRFGDCWDLSQIHDGYRSDSSEDSSDEAADVHSEVQYCRQSASYNNRVRLKTKADGSDEAHSSSMKNDLDKKEDCEIKRCKNVLDPSVSDDDDWSFTSDVDDSSYEKCPSLQQIDLDEKRESEIKRSSNCLDLSQLISDERRSQKNCCSSKTEATLKNIPGPLNKEISKSRSQRLKEKIVTSKEYKDIQENLEYAEHNKNWLYTLALLKNPRRNNDFLLDVLPPLIEEDLEEDDNVEVVSSHTDDIVTTDSDDGSKKENKQQKKRFKSVRKFLTRVFCCCKHKQPP